MGAANLYLPGGGKWLAISSPFLGAQAKNGLPISLAHGLWQPELRVPPGLADRNHFPCSTAWALYQFRHPCSFCVSWDPETTVTHLEFCLFHPLTPFQKGMFLTGADF